MVLKGQKGSARLAGSFRQGLKAAAGRKRPALTHWPPLEAGRKGHNREGGGGAGGQQNKSESEDNWSNIVRKVYTEIIFNFCFFKFQ